MLVEKDLVSWDRPDPRGSDALGNPTSESASGFPRTVKGNWQDKIESSDSSSQEQGLDSPAVARFFSGTFTSGRVGDRVTFDGVTYVCVEAVPRRGLFASTVAFIRYDMAVYQAGSQQTAPT